jgi:uncharacterized membrane protein YhaH (DUF805 family)
MISALFSFTGRLNRAPFWGFSLLLILAIMLIQSVVMSSVLGPTVAELIDQLSKGDQPSIDEVMTMFSTVAPRAGWIALVLQVVFSFPTAALCVKRRHDRNSSGVDVWIYIGLGLAISVLGLLGVGYTTMEVRGATVPVPAQWLQVVQLLMAIFGIYLFLVLAFLKGTIGPNNDGPDPLQG